MTKKEVTKCRLMDTRYQLEADKQFDLDSEINASTGVGKEYGKLSGSYRVEGLKLILN